jgi:hypothetical protein
MEEDLLDIESDYTQDEVLKIDANDEPYNIDHPNICLENITDENYKKWYPYLHKPFKYFYLRGRIKELTLPDGCQNVFCDKMNIEILNISDSVIAIYCEKNKIEELYLTKNLRYVEASSNYLTLVKYNSYPNNLEILSLEHNYNTHIDIDKIPNNCLIFYDKSAIIPQHISKLIPFKF